MDWACSAETGSTGVVVVVAADLEVGMLVWIWETGDGQAVHLIW